MSLLKVLVWKTERGTRYIIGAKHILKVQLFHVFFKKVANVIIFNESTKAQLIRDFIDICFPCNLHIAREQGNWSTKFGNHIKISIAYIEEIAQGINILMLSWSPKAWQKEMMKP